MSKQRLLSILRKLLILTLLVSAVLLFGRTGYAIGLKNKLRPAPDSKPSGGVTADIGIEQELIGMVQPKAVIVCGGEVGRYGSVFSKTTETDFLHFSAVFGEALGSAGPPEKLTEEDFRDHLELCGVSLQFYCLYPLELLSGLLGAEMSNDAAASQTDFLCLCVLNEQTELCYSTANGEYWRCITAVPWEGLQNRIAEYLPNNMEYAYENADLHGGDAYAVIVDLPASIPTLKYASTIPQNDSEMDRLIQSVGMNSYKATSYSEADGTVVFVDEETTLRVSPDGEVLFRHSGFQEMSDKSGAMTPVSIAWRIAEQSLCQSCGDAKVMFAGLTQNEGQRTVTIYLDYAVNGIPIQLESEHAAEIVVRGESIIQARVQMKQFFINEDAEAILPCLQALAIAGAGNTSAGLTYVNTETGLKCCWVNANG